MKLMVSHNVFAELKYLGVWRYRTARYVGWTSTNIVCVSTPLQQCISTMIIALHCCHPYCLKFLLLNECLGDGKNRSCNKRSSDSSIQAAVLH